MLGTNEIGPNEIGPNEIGTNEIGTNEIDPKTTISTLSNIGYYGPLNLLVLIFFMYYKTHKPIIVYILTILWQLFSLLLNIILKFTFKQKRPTQLTNSKYNTIYHTIYNDKYGMPSGHAQSVMAQLTFIIFYFKNKYITTLALVQTFITLWQRYYTNQHTINQLLIGSLIGIVLGLLFVNFIITIQNI